MIGLVLSTGVGGGAVIDNKLFTGVTGNSVHLGHISVNAWGPRCVCGGHGCTEMYARGPALVAAAKEQGWTGGDDARALTADARAGDEIALRVIDHGMRALAAGIATTATELDVAVVVLGGGVSKAGEVIFEPAASAPAGLRGAGLRRRSGGAAGDPGDRGSARSGRAGLQPGIGPGRR